MGQEIQGVSTPLITVQTPRIKTRVEKVRVIQIPKAQYRALRSFTESSLRESYSWRTALETSECFVWRKEGRWELRVSKSAKPIDAVPLPVRGIFKVTSNIITPFAVLSGLRRSTDFVVVNGEVGMLYYGRVTLAFTSEAPVAFIPATPLPYARPISIREVLDTLNHYVSF